MTISVVIPTRNNYQLLAKCLASLENQARKPDEVVVVDNDSTDETKKVVDRFKKRGLPIVYILEKKIGPSSARNRGIKAVKGEIIALIDSDCVAARDWIKNILGANKDRKNVIIQGEAENIIFGESIFSDLRFFWLEQHFFPLTRHVQKALKLRQYKEDLIPIKFLDTKNVSFLKKHFYQKSFFLTSLGRYFHMKIKIWPTKP